MKACCQASAPEMQPEAAPLLRTGATPESLRPSVAARVAAFWVRLYQLFLSPLKMILFGSACGCRFQPTCSCYAREAFLRYGFFKGFYHATRRILRCHPWHPGGYDPVPSLKAEQQEARQASFKTLSDG